MNELTQAITGTPWTSGHPRLARHDHPAGWLTGYVSARLDAHGDVADYQWWVEVAGQSVTASDPDRTLTAFQAVADADAALATLARLAATSTGRRP